MMIPENRNAKGEDFAKFAAEMTALAKSPAMRPYLTSTERRRQEREEKREEAEAKRRGELIDKWFGDNMMKLDPEAWRKFQETQDPAILESAGWILDMQSFDEERPGYKPRPYAAVSITRMGMIFFEDLQPINKLVTP